MDITKLFNTSKRYDKKTVGGIEIETCVKQKYYDPPEGSEYEATEDGSIECSDGLASVEYITESPFPIVDIMDGKTKIGKDTNEIMNNAYPCDTDGEFVTCGTHVHMSRKGITKEKYPNFNVLMRNIWLTYYQPYCLARFYRFQNRHKNTYAESSSEKVIDKYEMFNELPSRGIKPNEDWHFEFRGYGEMLSEWKEDKGAPKEYMRVLMNMWLYGVKVYDKYNLRQYQNLILQREDSPPNKENDEKLQNILYEFIRKPVPGSIWVSDGIMVKVHHVHADMVNYTIVLEENRKYLRKVWKKLGKPKTASDRTTTRTWMLQLCKINHPMLMGLDEFKKTYDYNGKRDETYEDKVGAFLTFFDSTYLWYSVQRVVPPKIPSTLQRGTLWTEGIKAIRIVNVGDSYVDYVYEKAYNQAAYEPYDIYMKKTDKFLKIFEFDNESKIEKGDWWFDSEDVVQVQLFEDDNVYFSRNGLSVISGEDRFYKTYTYGGPVRKNDLWNFGTAGEAGYEIVRVNDVDEKNLIVMITSLDNSIYKGEWMPLLNFLKKGTKLNRPPIRKGDIWCNSSGDKLPISKVVGGTYVHAKIGPNVWGKDQFLERYTFYRSADTKDIADPEEGATWYDGYSKFAKVEGQFGSYLINLNIDGQWVQMGFTKFLRVFEPLRYGNGELILVGDRVKIVKDGDEDDGKTAIVETFYIGMITVQLPRYQDEFEPHELEFLGRKESSLSGWWDDTDSDEEIIQKFNLKF